MNPRDHGFKLGDVSLAGEVADCWASWCGETQWVTLLRRFGRHGGRCQWWCGFPQSASAIPLCFTLYYPNGEKVPGSSRLKDIRMAVAALESEPWWHGQLHRPWPYEPTPSPAST